jgi:hypothetical protein
VRRMVQSFPADVMRAWEIGMLVNDPKSDDARVMAPFE